MTEQIGFLLIPNFSMISLSAAIDPLRMANRLSGKELYQWHIYTEDNQMVFASNGFPFTPDRSRDETQGLDRLIVVAGIGAQHAVKKDLLKWLRALKHRGVSLGSTSTGTVLLAEAGVLAHKKCTIHWENKDALQERFPELEVTGELYEIDRDIITCSGGLAGLDMMLQLISLKHGDALAKDVAEQCIHPNIRPAHEKQRMELQQKHHTNHPRLIKALELMRSNTEEVLTCREIGDLVGLSTRQLERLFKESLSETPANHYMGLRLEKAHHLLLQSSLSILQISTACGFTSTSYFARCFRKKYGFSPREERGRH